MHKSIFTQELEGTRRRGRPRKGWKEEVERDLQVLGVRMWRESAIDRKKMEGYCSTGQSPQWAVVPMEEEEEQEEEEEEETCVLLGYCAPSSGNSLPTFRFTLWVPYSGVKNLGGDY